MRTVVDRLRANGNTPHRVILSALSLRHLRDEGALDPQQNTVLDLPVDVDLAWQGEAFSIATHERLSLAEIVSAAEAHAAERLPDKAI